MTVPSRYWLAAAAGLLAAQPLWGGEPGRLGVDTAAALPARPALSPNQQTANLIAEQLRQGAQLRRYTINISFEDGVAELTGTVADQLQREEALRLVQGVPGVERVRDGLRLAGTGPVKQIQAVDNDGPELSPQPRRAAPPANGAPPLAEPVPVFQAPPVPYDLTPPKMPPYAWPTYAPYNNMARVAYPSLYPYNAWPFVGPVHPFPKVPLGWRSVKLEWDDGHWWYTKNACGHDWWRLRYW